MYQFYFLVVFFNIFIGYLLFTSQQKEEKQENEKASNFLIHSNLLRNRTGLLSLSVSSGIVAVMKMLLPVRGSVPIIGDLLPLASLGLIAVWCFSRMSSLRTSEKEVSTEETSGLLSYSKYIGIIGLVSGILHFIFPTAFLL